MSVILPQSLSAERRHWPRRAVISRVELEHERLGEVLGTSMNISDGGLLVLLDEQTQVAFPLGSFVQLSLLDSANPRIRFNSCIVRNNHQGLALRLIDYEYRGRKYSLNELRRQWQVSHRDIREH